MTTPTTARTTRKGDATVSNSPSVIAKGGTARSAVSSARDRSSLHLTQARRSSLRAAPSPLANGSERAARESLSIALKLETEEKEDLLVRIQGRDTQISGLHEEIDLLQSSLKAAESQLTEFYNEQARMEDELSAHHAITDKLREQLRETEKEKRELNRRYIEQTKAFEAERQSFYDNEQHLKSRIQSLTRVRAPQASAREGRDADDRTLSDSLDDSEDTEEDALSDAQASFNVNESGAEEDTDTPEISALKLELSTLSTSYASMQSTLQHLQTQLADLQRVNNELQDENESYNILLREKTMAGQFNFLKNLGDNDESRHEADTDGRSILSAARSTLDRVSELDELGGEEQDSLLITEHDPFDERSLSRTSSRAGRRVRSATSSPLPKGESLAGLPLTGPGLDLAAELGRAESKNTSEGPLFVPSGDSPMKSKNKRIAPTTERNTDDMRDIDSLRNEVKSLKDANKALSLYASKIIDRIIAQEGFEHVLAVDYNEETSQGPPLEPSPKRNRPQSAFFFSSGSTATTSKTHPSKGDTDKKQLSPTPSSPSVESKKQRRSMSFDWKSFSPWGGGDKRPENSNLRPLTLRPGTSSIVGAKKIETQEDEEDRKERERLNATMKLMGIEPSPAPSIAKTISSPNPPISSEKFEGSNPALSSRWSLFRSNSITSAPEPDIARSYLTTEALQQADASESLKQLDEKERFRIEEISRGSGGGFTEIKKRSSLSDEWRSRRDARDATGSTGSAGTVWSAGVSIQEDGSFSTHDNSSPSPFGSP